MKGRGSPAFLFWKFDLSDNYIYAMPINSRGFAFPESRKLF